MMQVWGKVRGVGALLVVAALILMVGCGSKPAGQSTGPAPDSQATTKPIVIGSVLPLTGPFADTAKWCQAGYEAWAEDVNSRGGLLGRKVELKLLNDEGQVDKTVQLLEKLITVDKVDLVLGGYATPLVAAQAPVAERYQYLFVGMGGGGVSFSQGYQYIFGAPPLMAEWTPISLVSWLKSLPADKRPKTLGLIGANNAIGKGVSAAVHQQLATELPDMKIVMDELHESPLPSAEALATRARQNQAEVLMIANNLQDAALILRSLKASGYQPKAIWVAPGPGVPEWNKELGALGEYVFGQNPVNVGSDNPGIKALAAKFQQKYNSPMNSFFLTYYNYGTVLEAAVNGTKSLDQTALRDYLRSHEINTPLRPMKFGPDGLPSPVSYLWQVKSGGKYELVWPKENNATDPVFPMPSWK